MGKIINLRTVRKQKAREPKAVAPIGIKKPERNRVASLNDMSDRKLDGHKRDTE